jgi:hypothetical protein
MCFEIDSFSLFDKPPSCSNSLLGIKKKTGYTFDLECFLVALKGYFEAADPSFFRKMSVGKRVVFSERISNSILIR